MTVKKTSSEPTELLANVETPAKVLSWQLILLKATGLSLIFVLVFLLITALAVSGYAYSKFSIFLSEAGLTFADTKRMINEGISTKPNQAENISTFLVLGLDKVANKQNAPPLTDTLLLITINYSSGEIKLLSLPRDLWSEEYKTKINALYYYGQERYPSEPQKFTREVISQMTGLPIHYTVIFSLDSVAELVDILGGLEVNVPSGFVDTQFPREDVDISTATESAELYKTVEFKPGVEKMSAGRVNEYIRSRHSQGDTGTDLDRSARQQLIINSLVTKIKTREVLTNPVTLAHLYQWYTKHLSNYISVPEAVSMLKALYPVKKSVVLKTTSLSITSDDARGVLEHLPPAQTDNQWTYSIVDPLEFKKEIATKLIGFGVEETAQ